MTTVLFAEHPTRGTISTWTVSDDQSVETLRKEMQATFRDCAITHRTTPSPDSYGLLRSALVTVRQYDSDNVEEPDADMTMTWGEFADANDAIGRDQLMEIAGHLSLTPGERYYDGGGAAARWSIERA